MAASVKDFFDMTDISPLKDQPNLLELIDTIYLKIIKLGFVEELCEARSKALRGPCAFNIFVKSNAVLNNWHLNDARRVIEERLRPDVKLDVVQEMTRFGEELSEKAIEQKVAKQLVKRRAETFNNIETLRAQSSEFVCLVLQEILRESNIRKCRDAPERVSLLAVVALTLEQVLDLVDNPLGLSTWDDRSVVMSRRMALVLLSYLHPPSALSFPKATALNRCFGKCPKSTAGVFMKDEFWYELYKASEHAIPAHLLQIAETQRQIQPPRPADLNAQMSNLSERYFGMNLRITQTPLPHNPSFAPITAPSVFDTYETTAYRTTVTSSEQLLRDTYGLEEWEEGCWLTEALRRERTQG